MHPAHSLISNIKKCEYLLILSPSEDVTEKIVHIKQGFCKKYKVDTANAGRPHITLASFVQYNHFQEKICQRLRQLSLTQQPFKIELSDFNSFPTHTILINVLSRLPIINLVKSIREHVGHLMKADHDNKPLFILEPHISVARKLKPWQYEDAWKEYSTKNFSGKFITSDMLLLKKEQGCDKFYTVEKFSFLNMPVRVTQASIF